MAAKMIHNIVKMNTSVCVNSVWSSSDIAPFLARDLVRTAGFAATFALAEVAFALAAVDVFFFVVDFAAIVLYLSGYADCLALLASGRDGDTTRGSVLHDLVANTVGAGRILRINRDGSYVLTPGGDDRQVD